jgi:hypothetical protein
MRQRTAKLSTANTTRQTSAGHQLAPQQGYGHPSSSPQVSWQQPVMTQGYNQPPVYSQAPPQQSRQYQQKGAYNPAPHIEHVDGAPPVIHHGKIQMKDAITLITLRLAKLEEMTSTPGFHAVMTGNLGDMVGDNVSGEIIDSISERLGLLETNVGLLFDRTNDIHFQLDSIKSSIQTIIDGTSIDHTDLIIQPSQLQDETVDVFQTPTSQPQQVVENEDEGEDEGEA